MQVWQLITEQPSLRILFSFTEHKVPFAETAQTSVFLILRTSDGAFLFSVPRPGPVGCSRLAVAHGHGAAQLGMCC